MKKKGIRILGIALAMLMIFFTVSLGAVYGMSLFMKGGEDALFDGSEVSVVKMPQNVDDRLPACDGDLPCVGEEQPKTEASNDESGILIHAVDLSRLDEDGKPEVLVANFSGMEYDDALITSLSVAMLSCDGSPEVLIYHTHASEAYASGDTYEDGHVFLSENDLENTVAIGNEFASVLEAHGIGVIHDTYHHSSESYNKAYTSSRRSVIDILSKYDTIKIVIDIHRDSVSSEGSERKPLAFIKEEPTAQVMSVVGSAHNGWQSNFANALAFQKALCDMFPGLARPIYLSKGEYNQSLFDGALLLEVGAAGNTAEEAKRAARLAAEAFCRAFTKYSK